MAAPFDFSKKSTYSRSAAVFKDLVFLSLKDRKLDRNSVPHSRVIAIDAGEWAPVGDTNWSTAGMCYVRKPANKLVVVGTNGSVLTYTGGKTGSETVAPQPSDLRGCGLIDGRAYACGMKRQVFRREGEGRWVPMHAPEANGKRVAGFEAIAGLAADDIYAVGWEGEIWHYIKGRWIESASPVNVILTGVAIRPDDGVVYACGQNGTLVAGREATWQFLDQPDLEDDFWDLRWFNDRLYVASMTYLYQLEGVRLVPVDFGKDAPDSCYKLTDAEGVLWSVGQEDLFSFDGKAWTRWD